MTFLWPFDVLPSLIAEAMMAIYGEGRKKFICARQILPRCVFLGGNIFPISPLWPMRAIYDHYGCISNDLFNESFLLFSNYRFSPTRTPSPWDGIRKSDKFSAVCPQRLPNIQNEQEALKKMPKGRLEYLKRLLPFLQNQSEDCLYLNVFSPLHGKPELFCARALAGFCFSLHLRSFCFIVSPQRLYKRRNCLC